MVKFIDNAADQIDKDPVLILLFLILSLFDNPKFDKSALPLVKEKAKLINSHPNASVWKSPISAKYRTLSG
jgi:hypothetical protein